MLPYDRPLGFLFACTALLGCGSPKKPDETKASKKPPESLAPVSTPTKLLETKPAASFSAENKPSSLPFVKEKLLLYDARIPHDPMPSLAEAEEEKILSSLFPKRVKKQENCLTLKRPDTKTYEEEVAAGQIVPTVLMYVTGSFTGPGLTQTLYIIDMGECNAEAQDRAYGGTTKAAYLFSNGELLQRFDETSLRDWMKVVDIDQDGISEVFALRSFLDFGKTYEFASLHRFLTPKGSTEVEGYEPHAVHHDSCKAIGEEGGFVKGISASVISYMPTARGKMPTFFEEKFVATCEKGAPYKPQ
jgi:hypothetical protein